VGVTAARRFPCVRRPGSSVSPRQVPGIIEPHGSRAGEPRWPAPASVLGGVRFALWKGAMERAAAPELALYVELTVELSGQRLDDGEPEPSTAAVRCPRSRRARGGSAVGVGAASRGARTGCAGVTRQLGNVRLTRARRWASRRAGACVVGFVFSASPPNVVRDERARELPLKGAPASLAAVVQRRCCPSTSQHAVVHWTARRVVRMTRAARKTPPGSWFSNRWRSPSTPRNGRGQVATEQRRGNLRLNPGALRRRRGQGTQRSFCRSLRPSWMTRLDCRQRRMRALTLPIYRSATSA